MEFVKTIESTATGFKNVATVRPINAYAARQGWYSAYSAGCTVNTLTSTINAAKQPKKRPNLLLKTNAVNVVELPEVVVMETMFINANANGQNNLNNVYNFYEGDQSLNLVIGSKSGNRPFAKVIANVKSNDSHSEAATMQLIRAPNVLLQSETCVDTIHKSIAPAADRAFTKTTLTNSTIFRDSSAIISQGESVSIKSIDGNIHSRSFRLQPVQLKNTNPIKISIRNCSQQTDIQQNPAIAIQCNRYNEDAIQDKNYIEFINEETQGILKLEDIRNKEYFMKFLNETAIQYCNKLYECKVCGEIVKGSIAKLFVHINVHCGPKILCAKCGDFVEKHTLLNEHNNCLKRCNKYWRSRLRCPYYRCNAIAISPLELYDHINEHLSIMEYNCTVCYKDFCTAGEFLRHLFLNAKCYTKSKRTRILYGLTSSTSKNNLRYRLRVFAMHTGSLKRIFVKAALSHQRLIVHICQLCLKRFLNRMVFQIHVNRCITSYKLRFLL